MGNNRIDTSKNTIIDMYKTLSSNMEDIKLYKTYLERVYSKINDSNFTELAKDVEEISYGMIPIFNKIGYYSIENTMKEKFSTNVEDSGTFTNLILELYHITISLVDEYDNTIRQCVCCKEKVQYTPISNGYLNQLEQYGLSDIRFETFSKDEYICPICNSSDRDRLIIAYMDKTKCLENNSSVLQFAPSEPISRYIQKNLSHMKYDTTDLFMKNVSFTSDIQNMTQVENESYDLWICSHVLEHVWDDRKALAELYRILKVGGIGLLLVPLDLDNLVTDEEIGCSEEENWRRFGQEDHVRRYSKEDFCLRIMEAGFHLEQVGMEYFGEETFKNNGLTETSILYVVTKNNQ